jgi:type II secretory pathway component PulC
MTSRWLRRAEFAPRRQGEGFFSAGWAPLCTQGVSLAQGHTASETPAPVTFWRGRARAADTVASTPGGEAPKCADRQRLVGGTLLAMPPSMSSRWIERRVGRVGLGLVALTPFFVSRWVATGVMAMRGGPEPTFFPDARAATKPTTPFHATSADAILAHNPFDGAGSPVPAAAMTPGAAAPVAGQACSGVRVSAIAFSADAKWSFAMVESEDASGKASLLRRRGGKVGERVVEYVGSDRVWLSKNGELCEARFFSPARAATSIAVAAPVRAPAQPLIAGIVRKGQGEFEVDRSVIERVRQDPSQLMAFGQLVPERDGNGTTLGVRLAKLAPGTLPVALGLESGDRLDTINGFRVGNPEQLMEAYARLSSAQMITLAIVRQGRPQSIDYAIR